MPKKMSMNTSIRKVEGKVDINFFAKHIGEIKIADTSRDSDEFSFESYQNQILTASGNFDPKKKYATLDGTAEFDSGFYALGRYDSVGWWGDRISDASGAFGSNTPQNIDGDGNFIVKTPEYIVIKNVVESNLSQMTIRGDQARQEYPTDFTLTFYGEKNQNRVIHIVNNNETVTLTDDNTLAVTCKFDPEKSEYYIECGKNPAMKTKLDIHKWSKPGTMAKISFFSDEHVEEFSGDKLLSLEVLEEKTANVDNLSYGITANYCNVKFLNENYRFFKPENFNLLRKNRVIEPYIRCAGEEFRALGTFYSDEWIVPSDSQFVTCKAYDALYGLKDIIINYGVKQTVVDGKTRLELYESESLKNTVIPKIEKLINEERVKSGILGNDIRIDTKGITRNITPKYTLIEKKSAWDILQDIAYLCCAHVYVNREGVIVFEEDGYVNGTKNFESGVRVGMNNAFTYSLPVTSKNVVNQLNIEYYDLVKVEKTENYDSYDIKIEDLIKEEGGMSFYLKFDKLYQSIENIDLEIPEFVFELKIQEINFDHIVCLIIGDIAGIAKQFQKKQILKVYNASGTSVLEAEKRNYMISDAQSILRNGIKEYTCKSSHMLEKCFAKDNADRILEKYKNGVSYLISDWRGNYEMSVGKSFKGDEEEGKTFECISNEMVLAGGFRTTTKGIEIKS